MSQMAHVQQVHFIVLANWNYPGGNNLAYVMQNDVRLMEAALRRKFLNALVVPPAIENTTIAGMAGIGN